MQQIQKNAFRCVRHCRLFTYMFAFCLAHSKKNTSICDNSVPRPTHGNHSNTLTPIQSHSNFKKEHELPKLSAKLPQRAATSGKHSQIKKTQSSPRTGWVKIEIPLQNALFLLAELCAVNAKVLMETSRLEDLIQGCLPFAVSPLEKNIKTIFKAVLRPPANSE